MFSAEVKVVFGFDPSGLFDKMIRAPWIGRPRTPSPPDCGDDEPEDELGSVVPESSSLGAGVGSDLGTFGTLIFGMVMVICPATGSIKNDASAMTAIRVNNEA